jgi:hypothetical protein
VQIIFATVTSIILLKKRILKLMAENNEITDLSQIIKVQANFYNILFSTNTNTSQRHELLFDRTNLFSNFLTEDDKKNVKVRSLKKSASKL